MTTISLDFSNIHSLDEFYQQLAHQFTLPDYFGYNLDALWDVITEVVTSRELPLPLKIEFKNLPDTAMFLALIKLFDDAVDELDGQLIFVKS